MKKYTYYFRHREKPLVVFDDGEPNDNPVVVTHNGVYGKMFLSNSVLGENLQRVEIERRDVVAITIEEIENFEGIA